MKKKILRLISLGISAVLAGTMLSGCKGLGERLTQSPSGADKLYTAQCEITVDGEDDEELLTYGGTLNRLGGGNWELTLDKPDTVAGLKIKLGEEGITASLGDLSLNLETDKIPSRAAFMSVFSALDNAAANVNSLDFSETETNLCYHGSCGGEKYTLLCDKTNNMPCGLNIGKITVILVNFTITGEAPEATVPETTSPETASPETTVTTTATETETVTVSLETTAATTTVTTTSPQTMQSITFTTTETTTTNN
ncbi:MAG: hypothetical protein ACI4K7_00865 [Oscillospiraceae bacterium]